MKTIRKGLGLLLFGGLLAALAVLPSALEKAVRGGEEVPAFTQVQTQDGAAQVRVLEENGEVVFRNMEDYLTGVVLGEIPADFEAEALKAQAVAARTYTRKARETGGKHSSGAVCRDPGCCQAYWDPQDYLDRGGSREALEKVRAAVRETDGLVLTYEGELIEAAYFACSGGRTEAAAAVWGTDYPYLRAADSPGEEDCRYFRDTVWFSKEKLEEALGLTLQGEAQSWIGAAAYTDGDGVDSWVLGGKMFSGLELRRSLGLRSTCFSVAAEGNGLRFETQGYGHRVGLSQYGAQAMAAAGADAPAILRYYYLGTDIGKYVEKSNKE